MCLQSALLPPGWFQRKLESCLLSAAFELAVKSQGEAAVDIASAFVETLKTGLTGLSRYPEGNFLWIDWVLLNYCFFFARVGRGLSAAL